ncbi:uncharacterized protein LOC134188132 [Corticium candelabrum]|uniref:uncharacterized protein LOC134188132 n=1 Tax=Corticium candelabrum TaxID=121492 RepID=UPI002E256FA3|nr:uncharacterized protein LOC134188132 [Corticium candelabrum]
MMQYLGTAQTVASEFRDVLEWIETQSEEIVAVIARANVILGQNNALPVDHATVARLRELVSVLEQCYRLLGRYKLHVVECSRLGHDPPAQLLREQIEGGRCDVMLARQFIEDFQEKVIVIQEINLEVNSVDCTRAAKMAQKEVGKLEDTEKRMRSRKIDSQACRAVGRLGAVIMGAMVVLPAVSIPVTAVAVGAVSWAGLEISTHKVIKTIARVLSLLKELKNFFVSLHHGIRLSQSTFHELDEWHHRANAELRLLDYDVQDSDIGQEYRGYAIADNLSELLDLLTLS